LTNDFTHGGGDVGGVGVGGECRQFDSAGFLNLRLRFIGKQPELANHYSNNGNDKQVKKDNFLNV
jgi:hypothetical protein